MFKKSTNFHIFENHILNYPTPAAINYLWSFGSIAGIFLVVQIISGLFLSMYYVADASMAFDSIEHIHRDINYGWLIKSVHANGASFFFFIVYLHIGKALYFKSFTQLPRVWISGLLIFILMMATAFMGYVLPWGQMSLWGATVITNLFSAIPLFGKSIVSWLWGGYSVDSPTLMRFYTLHFILPFVILGLVFLHLLFLHATGSTSPIQSFVSDDDCLRFSSYFIVKDLFGFLVFFFLFIVVIFWYPNYLGHPDNYIPANPLSTPAHIVPEWYFLPFYAILRSIPNKLGGVLLMFSAIFILFVLNFFDECLLIRKLDKTITNYKIAYLLQKEFWITEFQSLYKIWFWFFIFNFVLLGYLGSQPATEPFITISTYATFLYFFLLTLGYVFVHNLEYRLLLLRIQWWDLQESVVVKKS